LFADILEMKEPSIFQSTIEIKETKNKLPIGNLFLVSNGRL